METEDPKSKSVHPPLFIVSGGYGESGNQVAQTALAQFSGSDLQIIVVPHVKDESQLKEAVERAAAAHGTILHTLVNTSHRVALIRMARERHVFTIDLIGALLSRLTNVLGQEPVGQPGLYRQLREDYFNRVEAIEFSVAHDDGKRVDQLGAAEIVLVGPSRVGKTPLSMYLSISGWKVSNIALHPEVAPPTELFTIDRRRIVGLTIDPTQLQAHRKRRQRKLAPGGKSSYTDLQSIVNELELARLLFRKVGFPAVDVTDRTIEDTADEVVGLVKTRLNQN
jgi:regulator of PEP synthase PpsR (kinase-PPPase family)